MLAALEAMQRANVEKRRSTAIGCSPPAGSQRSGCLCGRCADIASLVAIDNGDCAGPESSEFGVTLAMADQTGPFDYHLTKKLYELCGEHDIQVQKDVFRYYRSDAASAVEAGHDVRTVC